MTVIQFHLDLHQGDDQSKNFHIKKICAVDVDLNATMPNYNIEKVVFAVIADTKMGHTRGHSNVQLECVNV